MTDGPYNNASKEWLQDNEVMLREVLAAAGQMEAALKKLERTFSTRGAHILDFCSVTQPELETSLRVCGKLMETLGPSANAMRSELEHRAAMGKLARGEPIT